MKMDDETLARLFEIVTLLVLLIIAKVHGLV